MLFCNPFDAELAVQGPPAVFLKDRQGFWRHEPTWTRDAWGRLPGPHAFEPAWALLRDHATGFVTLAYCTAPALLATWPRADVRFFGSCEEAESARAAFGHPPVHKEPWT